MATRHIHLIVQSHVGQREEEVRLEIRNYERVLALINFEINRSDYRNSNRQNVWNSINVRSPICIIVASN